MGTEPRFRRERHQDHKFAVVFMDVDQFKSVNDSLGHSAGDQLIGQISERLTGSIRRDDPDAHPADVTGSVRTPGNDMLARYGGDEFSIVLDEAQRRELVSRVLAETRPCFLSSVDWFSANRWRSCALSI
jgi:GGDEF domain-containing protein